MGLLDGGMYSPLMGLAQGLLASSGPSRTPISLGQAFATGLTGMNQAAENAQKRALMGMQIRQMQQKEQARQELAKYLQPTQTQTPVAPGSDQEFQSFDNPNFTPDASNPGLLTTTPPDLNSQQFQGLLANYDMPEYLKMLGAGAHANYGLNPVYGVDANGKTVLMQLNSQGGAKPVSLPDGVTPTRPLMRSDLGNVVQYVNPLTGQPVVTNQKGLAPNQTPGYLAQSEGAKASGRIAGTTATQAKIDLPSMEASSNYMIDLLEKIKNHPGLPYAVGAGSVLPTIPGTEQANFLSLLDQIKGKQFLQAYQDLKGGGQITEVEGKKATDALARMQRSQSPEDFKSAVTEFEGIVRGALSRAQQKAGGKAAQPKPTASQVIPPAPGQVIDGYRFKGGNPNDPNAWEKQ